MLINRLRSPYCGKRSSIEDYERVRRSIRAIGYATLARLSPSGCRRYARRRAGADSLDRCSGAVAVPFPSMDRQTAHGLVRLALRLRRCKLASRRPDTGLAAAAARKSGAVRPSRCGRARASLAAPLRSGPRYRLAPGPAGLRPCPRHIARGGSDIAVSPPPVRLFRSRVHAVGAPFPLSPDRRGATSIGAQHRPHAGEALVNHLPQPKLVVMPDG